LVGPARGFLYFNQRVWQAAPAITLESRLIFLRRDASNPFSIAQLFDRSAVRSLK
jgi:hypothetical protein